MLDSCENHRASAVRACGAVLAIALSASSFGCRSNRPFLHGCPDFPPGAIPPPAGTYTCRWQTAQMNRADAGKFVIHQNEWFMGGKTLGPDGERHVRQMGMQLSHVPYPVVISRSVDEQLNDERRQIIVDQLTMAGVADASHRVIIDKPEGEGLWP